MTMKVKFDFNELDKLGRRIGNRASLKPYFNEITTEMSNELQKRLITNTPVKTGKLRKGWETGRKPYVKIEDNKYSITLYNSVPYAGWVNYGHYAKNREDGELLTIRHRTVPKSEYQGTIGNEEKFVYGHFYVEKSVAEMQEFGVRSTKPKVMRQLRKWFNTVVSGKGSEYGK